MPRLTQVFSLVYARLLNIGEDRPIKKNLKGNTLTGKVVCIFVKGAEHPLFFKQSQDDYDFEISISNLAYRGLRIKEGQMVNVAFKWESIWVIPEGK